jgi:hypothetical protein
MSTPEHSASAPNPDASDGLDRCRRVLHAIAPDHNLYRVGQHDAPHFGYTPCGAGLSIRLKSTRLSTFDNNLLTRLVVAAHEHHVRVEISPSSRMTVEVTVHPRTPNGAMHERHPGAEALSWHVPAATGVAASGGCAHH